MKLILLALLLVAGSARAYDAPWRAIECAAGEIDHIPWVQCGPGPPTVMFQPTWTMTGRLTAGGRLMFATAKEWSAPPKPATCWAFNGGFLWWLAEADGTCGEAYGESAKIICHGDEHPDERLSECGPSLREQWSAGLRSPPSLVGANGTMTSLSFEPRTWNLLQRQVNQGVAGVVHGLTYQDCVYSKRRIEEDAARRNPSLTDVTSAECFQ